MQTESIEAWHFLGQDRRIASHNYGSNPHAGVLVEPGQTLTVPEPIKLRFSGLHASIRPIDALQYAPGPIVQRVRLSGHIECGSYKLCATERTCLWVMDASLALHVCAVNYAQMALDALIERGCPIDPRSQGALRVKMLWINGKATDAELYAARDAARDAARSAPWNFIDAGYVRIDAGYVRAAQTAVIASAFDAVWAIWKTACAAEWGVFAWDEQNAILDAALWAQYNAEMAKQQRKAAS